MADFSKTTKQIDNSNLRKFTFAPKGTISEQGKKDLMEVFNRKTPPKSQVQRADEALKLASAASVKNTVAELDALKAQAEKALEDSK